MIRRKFRQKFLICQRYILMGNYHTFHRNCSLMPENKLPLLLLVLQYRYRRVFLGNIQTDINYGYAAEKQFSINLRDRNFLFNLQK